MTTVIKNGIVIKPDCSGFENKDLFIRDGYITDAICENPDTVIDAKGDYILPGLIDIHTHGVYGVSFQNSEDFEKALAFTASQGITTILPTISTRPHDWMLREIENVKKQKAKNIFGSRIGGIHLEGPFISEKKRGAMMMPTTPCTVETFAELVEAADGLVRVMTLAPERENAIDVIKEGVKRGIRMSLGHTQADYDTAMCAIKAGATGATHVFNAMGQYEHRAPGVLGAVLTEKSVTCEAICDMHHLSPATVKLVFLCKGTDGVILVSDSGRFAGLGDGEYTVNGKTSIIKDGVSRNENGVINASTVIMAESARRLVSLGFSLCDIARIGALNPARAIGLDDQIGSLSCGKRADIIFCDESFNVKRVLVGGQNV